MASAGRWVATRAREPRRRIGLILAAVLWLVTGLGCSGISRNISGLPDWFASDPGAGETDLLRSLLEAKKRTPEELAEQAAEADRLVALHESGEFGDAAEGIEAFLARWPTSDQDERLRFLLGVTLLRNEEFRKSFRMFKTFSDAYVVSDYYPEVMEAVYTMGVDYVQGEHSSLLGLFSNKDVGVEMLSFVVERFPTGARAADAQWAIASFYYEEEEWPEADGAFKFLAETWPDSPWAAPSLYNSAYAKFRLVKGDDYDPATMSRAEKAFETYLQKIPEGPERGVATTHRQELIERRARHLLGIAEWYIGQDKAYSSRFYLNKLRTNFPQTAAAARAKDLLLATLPEGEALPPDATPTPTPTPEPEVLP